MAFLITTTGTLGTIILHELGGRAIIHPTVNFDLESIATKDEISNCPSLQAAIDAGYLTAEDDSGNPVSDISNTLSASEIKVLYESNANTNVFNDIFEAEVSKLDITTATLRDVLLYDDIGGKFIPKLLDTPNIITVGQGELDLFASIKDAVDFAATQSPTEGNEFVIQVAPGSYTEDPFTLPAYVNVTARAVHNGTVTVTTTSPNSDFITTNGNNYLSGLVLKGATGATARAVVNESITGAFALFSCGFTSCNIGSYTGVGATTVVVNNNITVDGLGQTVEIAYQTKGGTILASNIFMTVPSAVIPFYGDNPIGIGIDVDWDSGSTTVGKAIILGYIANIYPKNTSQVSLRVNNGCYVGITSCEFTNNNIALEVGAGGSNSIISSASCRFINNTTNFKASSATGRIFVTSDYVDDIKADVINTGTFESNLQGLLEVQNLGHSAVLGDYSFQYNATNLNTSFHFGEFAHETQSTGLLIDDGLNLVTAATGLTVDVAVGTGYLNSVADETLSDITWNAVTGLSVTANTTNYVYYSGSSDTIVSSTTIPNQQENILLAEVITDSSNVLYVHQRSRRVDHIAWAISDYLLDTRKIAWKTGIFPSTGSTVNNFEVSGGSYFLGLNLISVSASSGDATFNYYYNGSTRILNQTDIDSAQYDNAGTLTSMTTSYYKADTLFVTSDGKFTVVYGTEEFSAQVDAEAADAATAPADIEPSAMRIALVVSQEGAGIVSFIDKRPDPNAANTSGGGGVSDHGALIGLGDDDHTQYLLVDGTRAMSGPLNMGSNNITSAGTVNGVTVESHGSRHLPGGADALATAAPVAIGSANSEGVAASFARSDHVHSHGNQSGGSLHSVATTSVNGFMSAADKTKLDGIGVFGSEFQEVSAETQSSTTSGTFQTKLTLNASLVSGRKYRFGYYAEHWNNSVNKSSEVKVLLNGTQVGFSSYEMEDTLDSMVIGGFRYFTAPSTGTFPLVIQYRQQQGGTANIIFARAEVWRVS